MASLNKKNLKKVKSELEEIIEFEKHKLEIEKATSSGRIDEINKKINRIPDLEKKLAEIKDELNRLVFMKKERLSQQRESYSLAREIKRLDKVNQKIEKEGKNLASKLNLLSASALSCPICERKLTNPYKAMLLGEFKKGYRDERKYYQDNLRNMRLSQKKIKTIEDKMREFDIILLGKEELEKQKILMTKELEETKKLSSELPKLYEKNDYLTKELEKKAFAPLSQKMLREIEKK